MTRRADVPDVLANVAATLDGFSRSPNAPRVLEPAGEGDVDVNVGRLRRLADVELEFPSGSDRPVVGGAVRLAKRAVRRALRWYVAPIMEQQARFNHGAVDVIERLRVRVARLGGEPVESALPALAALQPSRPFVDVSARCRAYVPWFRGCRRVVHVDARGEDLLHGLAGDGTDAYATAPGGDPADHLRALEPGAIDGLFLSLVEGPRPPAELVALLRAARHALAPRGVVVVETASATDVDGGSGTRPVHPEAVRAALEATGFSGVRSETLTPAGNTGAVDVAAEIDRLDDLLTRRHVTALVATRQRA